MNTVRFVLVETDSMGSPIDNVLSNIVNNVCYFESYENGDHEKFIKFEDHKAAYVVSNLVWKAHNVSVCIGIWESQYPNEIDFSYTQYGSDKNNEVKKNRERE